MRFITAVALAAVMLWVPVDGVAQEISLYDSEGEAVAYIDLSDDLTIYLWEGKPVAYLDEEDVYGFNGNHLGWYSKGLIIDHDGDVACAEKERHPSPRFESFKGFKEFKSFKSFQEFAPFKPFDTGRFADFPCALFLASGS